MVREAGAVQRGACTLFGKYEIGRTLGEGNFGKVKYARDVSNGDSFAIKILDRKKILSLKIDDQIKREIETLKLLKHPNVVRLHEVSASKTKIYMVLEYINGGELFDRIDRKGKLIEDEARKLFQQLIDGVSFCHEKGVYHRDLKPENVLLDKRGIIKISDFGLSALPQHLGNDGLLHTTCGSPNYIAPEVISNRGYDGSLSDIWSCGVILYNMLVGNLPFEDRNIVVLYQKIFKGEFKIPNFVSLEAQNLLKRILDPNPKTRIDINGIKSNDWFKINYVPTLAFEEDEETLKEINNDLDGEKKQTHMNAFQLIGMSSSLDLSGFFEKEDISERRIRFTTNYCPKDLFQKIEEMVIEMGFLVQRGNTKLKVMHNYRKGSGRPTSSASFLATVEVFELGPSVYVVELRKSYGEPCLYRKLCTVLLDEFGLCKTEDKLIKTVSLNSELVCFEQDNII
ncbi:hypothetical protein LUZ60_003422 [Juncus effusus]|nr:hypothetical protein LUZ60_003422 [Juncus effusus]